MFISERKVFVRKRATRTVSGKNKRSRDIERGEVGKKFVEIDMKQQTRKRELQKERKNKRGTMEHTKENMYCWPKKERRNIVVKVRTLSTWMTLTVSSPDTLNVDPQPL